MTRIGIAVTVISVLLTLSGCTFVTITKVSPNSDISKEIKGQRFSLPRPYIKVTPKEDGSISADVIYLPDPEHSYVANSFSFFAYDALDVSTEDGIIKTISWTGDSSAVVADAIASAGTAASGILQAEQTKKADQKAKEDTASKAVDDAQLELDLAQSTLAFHREENATAKIKEATLAFQAAALKLSAAQAALARVRGTATSDIQFREKENAAGKAVDDAASELKQARRQLEDHKRGHATEDTITQARSVVDAALRKLRNAQAELAKVTGRVFGPKLFAIREEIRESPDRNTTSPFLEIITVEQHVEPEENGWEHLQPMYPVKWPEAPKVRLFPEGLNFVPDQHNNNSRWYTLQSSVPLVRLVEKEMSFKQNGNKKNLPPIKLVSPTVITVNLEGIQLGDYTLDMAYQTREHEIVDEKDGNTPVKFKIVQ